MTTTRRILWCGVVLLSAPVTASAQNDIQVSVNMSVSPKPFVEGVHNDATISWSTQVWAPFGSYYLDVTVEGSNGLWHWDTDAPLSDSLQDTDIEDSDIFYHIHVVAAYDSCPMQGQCWDYDSDEDSLTVIPCPPEGCGGGELQLAEALPGLTMLEQRRANVVVLRRSHALMAAAERHRRAFVS